MSHLFFEKCNEAAYLLAVRIDNLIIIFISTAYLAVCHLGNFPQF